MFLAGALGVILAIYVGGNVSGEEGEVWSLDGGGHAIESANSERADLM